MAPLKTSKPTMKNSCFNTEEPLAYEIPSTLLKVSSVSLTGVEIGCVVDI